LRLGSPRWPGGRGARGRESPRASLRGRQPRRVHGYLGRKRGAHPVAQSFRIESKEAIRAYYASIFQNYPIHKLLVRPTMYRTFGDNVVVTNGYQDLVWVDKAGTVTQISLRTSGSGSSSTESG